VLLLGREAQRGWQVFLETHRGVVRRRGIEVLST
jgi:hypothetical protein